MFVSGVLQMSIVNIPWEYFRTTEALHILASIVFTLFFVLPFILKHTYELMYVKKLKSSSGMSFGIVFLLILVSGVYLFVVGNRGGDSLGLYSYYVHLFGSFVLLIILFIHIKQKTNVSMIVVLFILINPSFSYSKEKLTNIALDENVSRYHNEDITSSASCKSCHPKIFNQWVDSNHRHIAGTNPYYMVMENLAAQDRGEEFRKWCMGCHNPGAITTKQDKTTHLMDENIMPDPLFKHDAGFDASRLEQGVGCVICHSITDANATGNSNYTLALLNRKKYLFEDSSSSSAIWLSHKLINANPKVHKQSYSKDLYKQSRYCASCHDEFLPESKHYVVSTYKEWKKSPYSDPKKPKKYKSCIDCHMRNIKDGKYQPLKGTSTEGGKIKDDIKVHYFSGANPFLAGLKNKTNEIQSISLLKLAAKLDVNISENKIVVGITNVGAGHDFPTGVSDFREFWLEITLKDAEGKLIFSSGKLAKDGDLKSDARMFIKVFGDKKSNPVGLFFWRYKKLLKETRIPAGVRRVETYNIKDLKRFKRPLELHVKLNFRIYPQWVTNAVQVAYPQLPNPPVITLNEIKKYF